MVAGGPTWLLLCLSSQGSPGVLQAGVGAVLDLFRAEELELLLCGNPVLDFESLEKARFDCAALMSRAPSARLRPARQPPGAVAQHTHKGSH